MLRRAAKQLRRAEGAISIEEKLLNFTPQKYTFQLKATMAPQSLSQYRNLKPENNFSSR